MSYREQGRMGTHFGGGGGGYYITYNIITGDWMYIDHT